MKRDAELISRATLSFGPTARPTPILGSRHRLSRISLLRTSLVAQTIKSLPATWETWVQSLGWEDPLQKAMAIHSSFLAWRIPCTEDLVCCSPWGHKQTRLSNFHFHLIRTSHALGQGLGFDTHMVCYLFFFFVFSFLPVLSYKHHYLPEVFPKKIVLERDILSPIPSSILVGEWFSSRKKRNQTARLHTMWVRNIPFISHVSYCDFPLGKCLETLCSMPITFIEGEMWSHPSLFLFYVLLCADGEPAMWGNKVRGPALHNQIDLCWDKTQAVLWAQSLSPWTTLALMAPMLCVRSKWQCNFPGCEHPPIGCIPAPPGFFWSEDCSWKLCCWASSCNSGYISLLAGSLSWNSKLERMFWWPPRQEVKVSSLLMISIFFINGWDFILTSGPPAFLLDTCNVPEVMSKFSFTACLSSDRSDALRAKFQCVWGNLSLFSCLVMSGSFATPWTVARQAPMSMEFPRQEHLDSWSGLPFPSPGDLPNPGY